MSRSLFTSRHGGLSSNEFESFNLALHVGDDAKTVDLNRDLQIAYHFFSHRPLLSLRCISEEKDLLQEF
jgi:copper oxidase (laccase) domain-containing protein